MATTSPIEIPSSERRARRLRLYTIAAVGAVAGLTLITTTQTWWSIQLATKSCPWPGQWPRRP